MNNVLNWVTTFALFMAMAFMGNQLTEVQRLANRGALERQWLTASMMRIEANNEKQDQSINQMLEVLQVSPKDVLPHVLRIEAMMKTGCQQVAR